MRTRRPRSASKSLAVFAVRPDRHVGLVAEPATLADVEAYEALVRG